MVNLMLDPWLQQIIQGIVSVIAAILHATVLRPYTFGYSGVPHEIWLVTDRIAWAAAGVIFSWEAIQYIWHPWTGSQNSPSLLIGRTMLAVLFAQASYWLLDLMLQVNNALVTDLLRDFATLGPLSNMNAVAQNQSLPFWILALIVVFLAGVLGIVFTWAARVAELILMVAIAPVAAILSLTESFRGAWRWLVREFAAAAFSQSVWALTVTLMFWALAGGVLGPATSNPSVQVVLSCVVGLGFVALSFRAQRWLKGLLFGQGGIAGVEHGVLELAAVYAAGRAVTGAYGAQIGQAMGRAGIGRYSQGWMRAEAGRSVQSAQVAALPEFAVPASIARSQGSLAAMADPAARGYQQVNEAARILSNASPVVASAQATRDATFKTAEPAGRHDDLRMAAGQRQAERMFERMYPPNPHTTPPPPWPPNPYTGHSTEDFLRLVREDLARLPGGTNPPPDAAGARD